MSIPDSDELLREVDPAVLCAFEHPNSTTPIKPLKWSIEKYETAQLLALSRMTMAQVSEQTGVPIHAIERWKRHPEFIEYMDSVTLETENTVKALRLRVLRKILDARLQLAEDSGNYAALSSKDTLDVLDALRKETEAHESRPESNYLGVIEELFKRSLAQGGKPSFPVENARPVSES